MQQAANDINYGSRQLGLVKYNNEEFKPGASFGDGKPSGSEISARNHGKVVAYVNGWRHNGARWQMFDHHMVTIVDEKSV